MKPSSYPPDHYSGVTVAPTFPTRMPRRAPFGKGARRALVATTMAALGEDAPPRSATWWQFDFVVAALGQQATEELVHFVLLVLRGTPTTVHPTGELSWAQQHLGDPLSDIAAAPAEGRAEATPPARITVSTGNVWKRQDGAMRTPGGVFFQLARERMGAKKWAQARHLTTVSFQHSEAVRLSAEARAAVPAPLAKADGQ